MRCEKCGTKLKSKKLIHVEARQFEGKELHTLGVLMKTDGKNPAFEFWLCSSCWMKLREWLDTEDLET